MQALKQLLRADVGEFSDGSVGVDATPGRPGGGSSLSPCTLQALTP